MMPDETIKTPKNWNLLCSALKMSQLSLESMQKNLSGIYAKKQYFKWLHRAGI
jgi:hypothetical protein